MTKPSARKGTKPAKKVFGPITKAECRRWIAALRSGEYAQGKSSLCVAKPDGQPDRFCCLGVLCDVRKVPVLHREVGYDVRYDCGEIAGGHAGMIPFMWLPNHIGEDDSVDQLAGMNDHGKRFTTIANHIERHILPRCKGR